MSPLRRAWAVLRGRNDPETAAVKLMLATEQDARTWLEAENTSLRASLDDAHRQHAITSAKAAELERVLRTILEAADNGLANPAENGR